MRSKVISFILAIGALTALSFGGRQVFAYDSAAAVAYAEQWWNGRNPHYNDYNESGGDCANFVSQCLIAGGLDLTVCDTCTWIDSKGCLPRCRDLHTYLVDYLHLTWETRSKGQVEPIWFLPGDPAIFGYSDAHPRTHAVFAVTGDATHYATCNAHSDNAHHVNITQFYTANPSFDRCTYYHISSHQIHGLDVSSYQGDINWNEVYNSGYRFAFARASWGDESPPTYVDAKFQQNMENGYTSGMLMGAYHFAYPDYGTDAASEARHFLNVAGTYLTNGYLRPVLDLERGESLGWTALSNWIHEWMDTVNHETGVEPILYTYTDYARNLDTSLSQYDDIAPIVVGGLNGHSSSHSLRHL